jgi:hypothetical protein
MRAARVEARVLTRRQDGGFPLKRVRHAPPHMLAPLAAETFPHRITGDIASINV